MSNEVRIAVDGPVGHITLTRPEALHALTLGMVHAMTDALQAWKADERIKLVLIDHEGGRGFCAGGDIRALVESLKGDGVLARRFFHDEYQLDHLLFTYPKSVVAVMDGVVMGGGVGISLPAKIRIATENTTFAMPECGIGLFPDVGGGWYLSRLKGAAGTYLALTGARIKAADCLDLGLCTHFVESNDLPALKAALIAAPERAAELIEDFPADPGAPRLAEHAAERDRLFAGESAKAIVAALEADGGDWARAQLDILAAKSPMMLAVTRKLLGYGIKTTDFAHELEREYALAVHTIARNDFMEGVRATVIDRDGKPRWEPASLDEITDDMVREMFSSLGEKRWRPLNP